MLKRPSVGFHQLVLRDRDGFEITRLGATAAAVGNRFAKAALLIKDTRAVADESPHGSAGADFRFRLNI